MRFFIQNFRWIMLIAGLLTCTMFIGLVSPDASLKSNFGETLEGSSYEIIIRNWGALIGLMGIMLIYGAFVPKVRSFALVIAGASKVIFIILVLSFGADYFKFGVGTAVWIDSIVVVLFIGYLIFSRFYRLA
jgi:hypothetical protein